MTRNITFEQLKGLIREGRFLNKVKGLDVEDNKLRSQILEDLKTIVDAEEDLSDAQSILNEMPKVDEISWELGENSGPGILYDRGVFKYLDLYGASITISEGEFDIYYQFSGVPGFGFGTVHFPGIVSFADAIMESKIVEYKALAFTDEDKEIIANAIHQMAMGIPEMLNKVEQLYRNKNMKINESTKVTLTIKQLKKLVKESSGDRLQELLDKPTTFDGKTDKHPIIGKVYYSKENKFAWKLVWNKARNEDRIHVFKPSIISVAGDKRFGWREYLISADLETMKEIGFKDFDSKEEAQKEFNNLVKEASEPDPAEPQGQYQANMVTESSLNIRQVTYADVEKHLQEVETWNPEDQRGKDGRPYNTTQFTKNANNSAMEWWFAYDGKDLVAVVGMDPECKGEGEVYLNEIMAKAGGGYGVKTMKWLFDHYAKQPGVKVLSFDSWSADNMDKLSAHYEKNFPDFKKEKNSWGGYTFTKNLEGDEEGQEELNQVAEDTKFTFTIGQLRRLIREATGEAPTTDAKPSARW